jgi:hypothetical protein
MNHKLVALATCAAVAFAACAPTTQPSSPPPPAPTTTPAPPSPPTSSPGTPTATGLMFAQFTKYTQTARVTDQGGVIYDYKYAGKADCSPGGDSGGAESFPVKVESSADQPASIRYTYSIPKGNCYAGAGVGFFGNDAQSVADLNAYSKVKVYLASNRAKLAVYIGKCYTEVAITPTLSAYTLPLEAFTRGDGCNNANERKDFNKFQIQDSFVAAEGVTNGTIQVGEVSFSQ